MRKRKKGKKLSRKTGPRRALWKSLTEQLILNGRIQTTLARAKALRPQVEKLITKARKARPGERRKIYQQVSKDEVRKKLMEEIGPSFAGRPGGYTRILKLGPRGGDGVEMALIELVGSQDTETDEDGTEGGDE